MQQNNIKLFYSVLTLYTSKHWLKGIGWKQNVKTKEKINCFPNYDLTSRSFLPNKSHHQFCTSISIHDGATCRKLYAYRFRTSIVYCFFLFSMSSCWLNFYSVFHVLLFDRFSFLSIILSVCFRSTVRPSVNLSISLRMGTSSCSVWIIDVYVNQH